MIKRLASIGIGLLLAGAPRLASAGGCCGTGPGVTDRLHVSEAAAISLSLSGEEMLGAWDRSGLHGDVTGSARQLRLDTSGLYRLAGPFSVGARVPLIVSSRSAGGLQESGGGLGDVAVLGRWDAVAPGGDGAWPGIGVGLAVQLPTGREGTDLLGAGTTGTGTWDLEPSLVVEQSWFDGWSITASTGLPVSLPSERADTTAQLRMLLAGGREVGRLATISAGVIHEHTFDELGSVRTAAVGMIHRTLPGGWSLLLSGEGELPVGGLGFNDSTGVMVGVGLRRAWMRE